ncbi:MAG: hypothetical protein A2X47_09675 [Lentisphaerae bacterium GWF2_38_69]|nr:MAG: hypothetical protein A2X47_09675 [Lentisphaerae bacterium GWF2_38_69]
MFYCRAFKKIRKEKKIAAAEVAKYLNKTRETISSWERGIYRPCDADIRIMAQFLNVSVDVISDLQERQTNDNYENSDLDIKDLDPNIAQKIKALHDYCSELQATNTGLMTEIYRFRLLMQNLPFVGYIKDHKLKYTNVNENFLNLFGGRYNKESIAGKSSSDLFDFKEYFPILELEHKVLQTKQRISNYQTYIPGTCKKRIGLLTITPILKEDKTLLRIVGTIEDITNYCADGERRKDLEEVINKLHTILWIGETADNDEDSFKYTFISDAILEIYGITRHDAFKDSKLWLKLVHHDDIEIVQSWMGSKEFPKKIKFKINHPEKGVRWISSEVFKMRENKFYGVIADITKEIEKASERYNIENS